jgi:hypothetical protein
MQAENRNKRVKATTNRILTKHFVNDAEGLNSSGFRVCSAKSTAWENKAANSITLLPTIQDRGAQPTRHVK